LFDIIRNHGGGLAVRIRSRKEDKLQRKLIPDGHSFVEIRVRTSKPVHPMAHMSLAVVGIGSSVMSNSHARYLMVPVCVVVVVNPVVSSESTRVRPKSQIRARPSSSISIFV
jgi:ABC-type transport system involved in cytochrome bd biosynthesis fused ATPase/permease subunit